MSCLSWHAAMAVLNFKPYTPEASAGWRPHMTGLPPRLVHLPALGDGQRAPRRLAAIPPATANSNFRSIGELLLHAGAAHSTGAAACAAGEAGAAADRDAGSQSAEGDLHPGKRACFVWTSGNVLPLKPPADA